MRKFLVLLAALAFGLLSLAAPASAHGGGKPDADNKKIDICHATGSESNPYTKNNISVKGWYNGHKGHDDDIWEAFAYTDVSGKTVNVPAQGDTSLLAFNDCKKPKVDKKITKPESIYKDVCGTENDVFSVPPGEGYTVSDIVHEGNNMVIKVNLEDGFAWAPDGNKQELRFVENAFTDEDCDLPETGLAATYNTPAGYAAMGLIGLMGAGLVTQTVRRRRVTA